MRKLALLAALCAITACESSREIEVNTTDGLKKQEIRCVGVSGKGKVPGIDYDYSARNIIVGAIFFQIIAPPVVVLVKEFECPIGDTTAVRNVVTPKVTR